jgi:hypothetical protein
MRDLDVLCCCECYDFLEETYGKETAEFWVTFCFNFALNDLKPLILDEECIKIFHLEVNQFLVTHELNDGDVGVRILGSQKFPGKYLFCVNPDHQMKK